MILFIILTKTERKETMSILDVKDISFSYLKGSSKKVLNHITVSFEQGKFYAIVGRSGNGKSTLLSLLAGLGLPDEGEILYEGKSTSQMNLEEYRREKAAVIYQDFGLLPLLTVLENIKYPMELCHIPDKDATEIAIELASKVSLNSELLHRYPSKISGGEQQRVAVARALTMERKLLLADEPTGNLDTENTEIIISLLQELAHESNKCVIVVTHDLDVISKADIVYKINNGEITQYK